jgi:ABC-type nitrate/sulfonate/bicarbonate transport system substrate-binding protein
VSTPGGSTVDRIAALTGGSADIAAMDSVSYLASQENGSFDGIVVASSYGVYEEDLNLARELPPYDGDLVLETVFALTPGTTLANVASKAQPRFAYRSPTSSATLGLEVFLEQQSFDATGVEWLSLPTADDRLSALLAGEIDGAVLSGAEAHKALGAGATLVAYPTAYWLEPGPLLIWVTTTERATSDPESLAAFQRVMYQVAQELNAGENREDFKEFLAGQYELSPEALDQLIIPRLSEQSFGPADFDYFAPKMVAAEIVESPPKLDDTDFLEALIEP